MSKNKAILFDTSAFLSETLLWSYSDIGKYIRLLCVQHQQGGLTEEELLELSQGSERIFEKFERGEDGRYFNARMRAECEKRAKHSAAQRGNVNKRWERYHGNTTVIPRYENGNTTVIPLNKESIYTDISNGLSISNGIDISNGLDISNGIDNSSSFYQPFSSSLPEGQIEEKIEEIEKIEENGEEITPIEDSEENGGEIEESEQEKMFAAFWLAYPKKKAKADAYARWMKMKPSRGLLQVILTAIEAQKKTAEWQKDGGQYIPYPATWLHRQQWEDEITPISDAPTAPTTPHYSNYDAEAAMAAALARTYSD